MILLYIEEGVYLVFETKNLSVYQTYIYYFHFQELKRICEKTYYILQQILGNYLKELFIKDFFICGKFVVKLITCFY